MATAIKQETLQPTADVALLTDLDAAAKEFNNWQNKKVKAALALYKVMEHAMAIGTTYHIDILHAAAKANNLNPQKNSTAFGLASKLVFRGIDSGSASTYSTVMEKANTAGIKPSDLSAWIVAEGGISAIRNSDATALAEKRKAENEANIVAAKALVADRYTTPITFPAPNPAVAEFKIPVTTKTVALLAKINDAGDLDIVFSYTDTDVIETLYRKMGEAMTSVVKPSFSQVFAQAPAPLTDEQEDALNAAAEASK